MSTPHHHAPTRRATLARLATIAACAPAIARAADLRPLHLATNLSESASNAFYAEEQGFFRAQGIDARIETFATSGAYANGVVAGTFDIGCVESGSMSAAHTKGIPFVLLANGGVYNPASPQTMLCVGKDSPLANAPDFNGKTIAVSTMGGSVQVAVMAWMDKNGGDYKSVAFVEVPPGLVADALKKGRIDAGFLGEPFLTQGADEMRRVAACSTAVGNRFLVTGWATSRDWLVANPAVAKSFQIAMSQASQWAMKNRSAATELVARKAKIPLAIAQKMHHVNWEGPTSPELVQPIIDAMVKYGMQARGFAAAELFA